MWNYIDIDLDEGSGDFVLITLASDHFVKLHEVGVSNSIRFSHTTGRLQHT